MSRYNPGELGKLIGLDRIPEQKCMRNKIKQLVGQNKASEWMAELSEQWVGKETPEFYYVDGHVQVYHGYKAILGKKHVSRQKLCMPGMQEFWVNNAQGDPYFFITGIVNQKLLEALNDQVVPRIKQIHCPTDTAVPVDANTPVFTIVFDREAYSPEFFGKLWKEQQVAVLTYRKNVDKNWSEDHFTQYTTTIEGVAVEMALAEKQVELDGVAMREIRKKGSNGHQTSIVTNHPNLSIIQVAVYMFSRWTQENFFKYLRQNYDMDRIVQYAVDQEDQDFKVVNPAYSKVDYTLKKTREKIVRKKAKLFELQQKHIKDRWWVKSSDYLQKFLICNSIFQYTFQ